MCVFFSTSLTNAMIQDHKCWILFRPNKNISVFQVTGLKKIGRVGTHNFLNSFLLLTEISSKMHKNIKKNPEN